MKQVIGYVLATLAALAVVLGLLWVFQGNDFFLYRTFAPKMEQVRRTTFEQSKAYNQGMIQRLQLTQEAYIQADSLHRVALGTLALHEFADYDESRLPPYLAAFLHQLRSAR